jgi:hypothetical protein
MWYSSKCKELEVILEAIAQQEAMLVCFMRGLDNVVPFNRPSGLLPHCHGLFTWCWWK